MIQNWWKLNIGLVLIAVFPFFSYAQFKDTLQGLPIDTSKRQTMQNSYIEKMVGYLGIKLSMNNDIKGFDINNTTKSEIAPNSQNALRITVNYRRVSVSFSTAPKFMPGNNDDAFKGNTEFSSFSMNYYSNHWAQNLSFSKVNGFYLKNTADYKPDWIEGVDPYIQFPDLAYTGYEGQTAYKLNENFSLPALSTQAERQLKSAGSLIPALLYNYYIIDNKVKLTGQNSSQKSNNLELLISIGYYYTFVLKKSFYVSAGISPGAGLITTKLLTRLPSEYITTHYTNTLYRLTGSFALGYNAERFFAGGQFIGSGERYVQSKTINVVVSDRITYQVFFGYRFKTPGFVKKTYNNIDLKLEPH